MDHPTSRKELDFTNIFHTLRTQNWVSNIMSVICCSNTTVVCIDTFKQKWSSWTLPHWARLIDTLSQLSINDGSLDLQTPHIRSRAKETPTHIARDQVAMASLGTICPSRNTRRSTRRRRRTRENGVSTIKVLGTTPTNVAPISPSWSS
jgi:hypothetical protein